jgi:hypothetical protein
LNLDPHLAVVSMLEVPVEGLLLPNGRCSVNEIGLSLPPTTPFTAPGPGGPRQESDPMSRIDADELAYASITELHDLMTSRKVSPVEVMEATFDRIDAQNGRSTPSSTRIASSH